MMLRRMMEARRRALMCLPALPIQGWNIEMAKSIDTFVLAPSATTEDFPHGVPEAMYLLPVVKNTYWESYFFIRGVAVTADLQLVTFESPLVFGQMALMIELTKITRAARTDPRNLWWTTLHRHRVVFPRLFMP